MLRRPSPFSVIGQSDPAAPSQVGGCDVLPADDMWNTPIDTLPVDPSSDAYIKTIGADVGFHPDFGGGGTAARSASRMWSSPATRRRST